MSKWSPGRDAGVPITAMLQFHGWPHDPGSSNSISFIADAVLEDAQGLARVGYTSVMVQNLGSRSPWRAESAEELAAMSALTAMVRHEVPDIQLGLNLPSDDPVASIAAAYASRADFVRLKVFVGVMRRAEGTLDGCGSRALAYRRQLRAEHIEIWADVHDRTGEPVWPTDFAEGLLEAEYVGARTFVVTGKSVSDTMHKLSLARTAVPERTLVVGGGVDDSNVTSMLERADRVIVGNYLQDQARVGRVDLDRAQRLLEAARGR